MKTIALIGADGSGKTTIGRRLESETDYPLEYIYMGNNISASNYILFTTRLWQQLKRWRGKAEDQGGPLDPAKRSTLPTAPHKRLAAELKSLLRTSNLIAEEWYRQLVVFFFVATGKIVVLDRHYLADYFAHDVTGNQDQPLARRLHGWMLKNLYPRPDLVILLDAPAEVLFTRKQDGTLELIEQRRQEYFQLRGESKEFVEIDASQPLEVVFQAVKQCVDNLYMQAKQ